ncbi:MAG: RNA-guided endonuclease InsQ/TnpB family protein [Planktothrix sp.]
MADALVPEINETMLVFAVACDWINANTPEKMTNKTAMQSLVYQDVRRNFGLSSNLAIQAIRRVCANRKTAFQKGKQVKKFSPTSVSYDARIFSFRETDWTVSIKLLNSRQRLKLLIGNYQVGLLKGQEPTSAVLVKRRNGEYYIHITIDQPTNPITETNNVLGVDLGRTDIATTSEGESWSGKQITDKRNHYAKLRASLQKKATKGTRSTRRRCRQLLAWLSGKEKRFQKHINHEISRLLVNHAVTNKKAIAIEDLTGIRERTNKKPRSKIDKRLGNSWAFYQLRQFLTYKCILAGVKLILVNPAWTSQTCHKCLAIGDRKGKKFSCSRCGNQCDADYNGAKNIEALGRIINTPGGSGLSCKLKTEVQYIQLSLFDDLGLLKTSTSA